MKIINKQGRLFERISIIDFLAIAFGIVILRTVWMMVRLKMNPLAPQVLTEATTEGMISMVGILVWSALIVGALLVLVCLQNNLTWKRICLILAMFGWMLFWWYGIKDTLLREQQRWQTMGVDSVVISESPKQWICPLCREGNKGYIYRR